MDTKNFINEFRNCRAEEMEMILNEMHKIAEATRIKEEIEYFDLMRKEGRTIEKIVCHTIGSDDLGTYSEYSITLRHKNEEG